MLAARSRSNARVATDHAALLAYVEFRRNTSSTVWWVRSMGFVLALAAWGLAIVQGGSFVGNKRGRARLDVVQLAAAAEIFAVHSRGGCARQFDLHATGLIKNVVRDPWGEAYDIHCPGPWRTPVVCSSGPDGLFETGDDICSVSAGVARM